MLTLSIMNSKHIKMYSIMYCQTCFVLLKYRSSICNNNIVYFLINPIVCFIFTYMLAFGQKLVSGITLLRHKWIKNKNKTRPPAPYFEKKMMTNELFILCGLNNIFFSAARRDSRIIEWWYQG